MPPARKAPVLLAIYLAGLALLLVMWRPARGAIGSDALFAIVLTVYVLLLRLVAKLVTGAFSESDSE